MYVPALQGTNCAELGHASYQHPQRQANHYDPQLDNFAALVIYTSLRALAVESALWNTYNTGENLIFSSADFKAPQQSILFQRLKQSSDTAVQTLAAELEQWCSLPIVQIGNVETVISTLPNSLAPVLCSIPAPTAQHVQLSHTGQPQVVTHGVVPSSTGITITASKPPVASLGQKGKFFGVATIVKWILFLSAIMAVVWVSSLARKKFPSPDGSATIEVVPLQPNGSIEADVYVSFSLSGVRQKLVSNLDSQWTPVWSPDNRVVALHSGTSSMGISPIIYEVNEQSSHMLLKIDFDKAWSFALEKGCIPQGTTWSHLYIRALRIDPTTSTVQVSIYGNGERSTHRVSLEPFDLFVNYKDKSLSTTKPSLHVSSVPQSTTPASNERSQDISVISEAIKQQFSHATKDNVRLSKFAIHGIDVQSTWACAGITPTVPELDPLSVFLHKEQDHWHVVVFGTNLEGVGRQYGVPKSLWKKWIIDDPVSIPKEASAIHTISPLDTLIEEVSITMLQKGELCSLLDWDLTRLRNAPYARHGYIFHDARLRTYFSQKAWYKPTTASQNVAEGQFSPAERANIALIQHFKGCE